MLPPIQTTAAGDSPPQRDAFPLAHLPIGKRGRIVDLPYGDPAMTRLRELGILPNTTVEVLRQAPLGDPLEICVRGCLLSLRKADAQRISVTWGL